MRTVKGNKHTYWANLRLTGPAGRQRLAGHVWVFGMRFDIDLPIGADGGFAAITLDGDVTWFEPNDPRLPTSGSPLELLAHIYVAGEIVGSAFACAACSRELEPDEPLPLGYDGEVADCRQCATMKAAVDARGRGRQQRIEAAIVARDELADIRRRQADRRGTAAKNPIERLRQRHKARGGVTVDP